MNNGGRKKQDEDVLKIIGKNLKEIRKNLNYTQKEFAITIGMQTSNLCSIEKGKAALTITRIVEICNKINKDKNRICITPDLIFKGVVQSIPLKSVFDTVDKKKLTDIYRKVDMIYNKLKTDNKKD